MPKFKNILNRIVDSRHDQVFEASQWVPQPRTTVFPFFTEVTNLEILTPSFLNFKILRKSTTNVESGTEIDYKLKLHGFPIRWRTRIYDWNPEIQFKDVQVIGPFKKWEHTHTFEDLAGGTLLRDRVIYRLPLAGFGGNLMASWIAKDVRQIFEFRKQKIRDLFGASI